LKNKRSNKPVFLNPGLVMWDFVMDKSGGAGAGFLSENFGFFPLPIYIPSASPQSSFTITRGWHNMPGVAAVPIASQFRIIIIIKKQFSCCLLHAGSLLGLLFSLQDGGYTFNLNFGCFSTESVALHPTG
jgi:hypothetical protein